MRLSLASILLALMSGIASAHDTWLLSDQSEVAPNARVTFELTSGMKFPALEVGPKPDRIARAGYRVGGESGELKEFRAGEKALGLTTSFAKEGVATVWLQALPKVLELTDEQVAEYLEEIRAPEDVRSVWERHKPGEKWKEEYVKCAKTCIAVGHAEGDNSWSEPVGLMLEILPTTNPTTLKAGEKATFRLLRNSQPLPECAIALVAAGTDERVYETTDAQGNATFALSKPGKFLLASTLLTPGKEGAWQSVFSTFTLEAH